MSDNIMHNQAIIVNDHELVLDHAYVDAQLFSTPVLYKDHSQVMIKITEKENKRMLHITNKPSKKSKAIKGRWSYNEDKLLMQLIARNGAKQWGEVAKMIKGRAGKQCRERWHNHLRPDIKKDIWTNEEDRILVEAHKEVGNKWTVIADRLPGRSENTIKNHWNATKRRVQSWRTKGKDLCCTNILINYIISITDDNNSIVTDLTVQEFNNNDVDERKYYINELLVSPNLEAEMQTITPLTNGPTISTYPPIPTNSIWKDILEIFDGDEFKDIDDFFMNLSLEAEMQTITPLTSRSTTSTYPLTTTNSIWGEDISEIAEFFDYENMNLTSDEFDKMG